MHCMSRSGTGTAGTPYNGTTESYPGVPYSSGDFNTCDNCGGCCCINAWQDVNMVRNCRLMSLIDLNQKVRFLPHTSGTRYDRLITSNIQYF